MAYVSLSTHDINVLEKIKDPESNPLTAVRIDTSLPRDPHISDSSVYDQVVQKEREIVLAIQQLEYQLAGLRPQTSESPLQDYRACVSKLDSLISNYPQYASAKNNRAQALRRMYGDAMHKAAATALDDLDTSIALLSPPGLQASISPQAAKTLSMAYTQRAALYHQTAKLLAITSLDVDGGRAESGWSKLEFEEAASRDFALGGHFGNEIAKGLAVSTNPTAKLCGEMVREAMKKEYGPSFGG